MNNVKVTKQFVEYSKELAEDILGYNRCFHYGNMSKRTNNQLIYQHLSVYPFLFSMSLSKLSHRLI